MRKSDIIKKIHLIISIGVVAPAAVIYAFHPDQLFDVTVATSDEHSIFKAIAGLYLGFSFLWAMGLFRDKFLKIALVSNMVFMLGLGFGRCIALVLNGFPSLLFALGIFGELALGFYGLWVFQSHDKLRP